MKIINDYPPIWKEASEKFDLTGKKPIFAYGDCIYNPFNVQINQDLIEHEMVHMKQQGGTQIGAKLWWIRYLGDTEFMLSQEVEAYHVQYVFMKKFTKDRNQQFKYLHACAQQLSSKMYGNSISLQEAMNRIK